MPPVITIYTDGSALGNPGPGGYGVVLLSGPYRKELSQGFRLTTNNRMELTAVIAGLKMLKEPVDLNIYSDSAYTVNAFLEGWIYSWQINGWRTANKKPVQNIELWQELLDLIKPHNVTWNKVKGHADNIYNNRCDALATGEIAKHQLDDINL